LRSTDGIIRPLLPYSKEHIREYAHNHVLAWNEDRTNQDTTYLRNYIRLNILPRLSAGQRAQLLILIEQLTDTNDALDAHIINLLHTQPALNQIDRPWFIHLPHDVAKEVLHTWLHRHDVKNIQKRTIERLLVAMKTAHAGRLFHVDKHHDLHVGKHDLALHYVER
jgi:tRNA(Ile)-lysidine synthase